MSDVLAWYAIFQFLKAKGLEGHPRSSLVPKGSDAGPVTRRAIETARLAFALTYKRENLDRWAQYEARRTRWADRREGRKPPPLQDKLELPKSHPLLTKLGAWRGILS